MSDVSKLTPKKRRHDTSSESKNSENHDLQAVENTISEVDETENQLLDLNRYLKRDLETSESKIIENQRLKKELEKSKADLKSVIGRMIDSDYPRNPGNSNGYWVVRQEQRFLAECVLANNPVALNILLENMEMFEGVAIYSYSSFPPNGPHLDANALHIAARYGNYKCAEVLIKHGFKVTDGNYMNKQNVLFDLISNKNKVHYENNKIECKTNYSWKNLEKFTKLLLTNGVDLNYQDINGLTVLHQTANDKSVNAAKFIEFFAKNGANINMKNKRLPLDTLDYPDKEQIYEKEWQMFGQTALHLALRPREYEGDMFHLYKTKKLYSRETKPWDITAAAEIFENRQKVVETLLKCDADPNICDQFGNNFLHYAAACGFLEFYSEVTVNSSKFLKLKIDKMLSENVDKTNEFGDTPLIFALQLMWDQDESAMIRTIELLHKNGADLSHKNDFGYTPLLIAKLRDLTCVSAYLESFSAKMGIKGETTENDKSPAVSGMDKIQLFEIVKSYGYDKYIDQWGCRNCWNCKHIEACEFKTKSSCEYLRKLVLLDLGRFSTEYKNEIQDGYDRENLKHVKVRAIKFSSMNGVSKFLASDPELKTIFVEKFGDKREDLCLVCMTEEDRRSQETFTQCGHGTSRFMPAFRLQAICADCLELHLLLEEAANFKECPMCKQKVEIIL